MLYLVSEKYLYYERNVLCGDVNAERAPICRSSRKMIKERNPMKIRRGILTVLTAAASVTLLSGCARSVLNYQVAECIGTLNKYENNEPVETPKMQAQREQRESEEALEKERTDILAQAEALALSYYYEEAAALIQNTEVLKGDERASEAVARYQGQMESLYEYELDKNDIGHLCFTNLIVDTTRAFDGDSYSQTYRENMITLTEFENILNTFYESGYVLVNLQSLAEETQSARDVLLTAKNPVLPQGKKPIVFSVENLTYASVANGDGVATRLALDENGEVGAVYTDENGHELIGAYDVIPVLEQFIEEHPDFSYQGARGVISISGKDGAFGYLVEEDSDLNWEENANTVKAIADKLREDGWAFASAGYSYQWMGNFSYDELKEDITKWQASIGSLIGECNVLLYPYGSEVSYETEKAVFLIGQGFRYLVGSWPEGDHIEVNDTYLRQTRRMVTGYVLDNYPGYFSPYFGAGVIDEKR